MKRKEKKGVELTLSTLVIAALVLMVLLAVVLIFTGGFKRIVPSIQEQFSCDGRGGTCLNQCNPGETSIKFYGECGNEGEGFQNQPYCCIPE